MKIYFRIYRKGVNGEVKLWKIGEGRKEVIGA